MQRTLRVVPLHHGDLLTLGASTDGPHICAPPEGLLVQCREPRRGELGIFRDARGWTGTARLLSRSSSAWRIDPPFAAGSPSTMLRSEYQCIGTISNEDAVRRQWDAEAPTARAALHIAEVIAFPICR